jgi:hypothetical protein
MKTWITAVALTLGVTLAGGAFAHGAKPTRGGIAQTASDLQFELVQKEGKAILYVDDHGKPYSTKGATGKLTLLKGKEKTEVPLETVTDNTLQTKDEVKLEQGTKAIASITFSDKKTVAVRFVIK